MQKILGIDIGSYSVKVAEMERSFRQFQLVGFFEQPIVHSEALGREGSINQALNRLFEEYPLSTHALYTALPGQMTAHRLISLPFSDFKKVDATLEFEMESYLPLAVEELLIDYRILSGAEAQSNVLVSYAQKSEFVKFLNMMSGADLDPRFVGSEPVEMENVMKLGVIHPEGAYAVIDLGHEKTNVAIFIGGKLQYLRTIMIGGKILSHAISTALKVPLSEAERLKIEIGQVGPGMEDADATTRAVCDAMMPVLSDLRLQLKQTFMAFQTASGEAVQALLLCGGTSRLGGLDQYLSSELRKNVSFLDCLDFPFNRLSDSQWCRPIAATAVALAYRGVVGSGMRDIQFRKGEFAFQGELKEVVRFVKQVGLMTGAVCLFAMASFVLSYGSLRGGVKRQHARVEAVALGVLPEASKKILSNPTAVLSTLAGKITEAEEKRKKVEEETKLSVLEVLKEFSKALPPRETVTLDIDDFTLVSRKVRVQGKTNSFEAVDQIKTALSQSKYFKGVAAENVKKGVREEVKFSLSLDLAGEATDGS